jgi:hypothetical protein
MFSASMSTRMGGNVPIYINNRRRYFKQVISEMLIDKFKRKMVQPHMVKSPNFPSLASVTALKNSNA